MLQSSGSPTALGPKSELQGSDGDASHQNLVGGSLVADTAHTYFDRLLIQHHPVLHRIT
jgi:hypothetical protein